MKKKLLLGALVVGAFLTVRFGSNEELLIASATGNSSYQSATNNNSYDSATNNSSYTDPVEENKDAEESNTDTTDDNSKEESNTNTTDDSSKEESNTAAADDNSKEESNTAAADDNDDDDDNDNEVEESVTVSLSNGNTLTSQTTTENTSNVSVAVSTAQDQVNKLASLPNNEYVKVTIEGSVGSQAKSLIDNTASRSGVKVASYLEITLNAMNANGAPTANSKISQLKDEIEFTVAVPDGIDGNQYDFAVIRIHNGSVTILPDIDNDPNTVTFKTDKFSAYAVIYGDKGAFNAYRKKVSSPKTGDCTPFAYPVVFGAAMFTIGSVLVLRKRA